MRIIVYVPGVETSGIEIRSQETDLTVIARKSHILRRNWRALHLERAQRDYLLHLRLGQNLDQSRLRANLDDSLLTIEIPTRIRASNQNGSTPLMRSQL